jgi:predicted RNase H-like HicB family nuclease
VIVEYLADTAGSKGNPGNRGGVETMKIKELVCRPYHVLLIPDADPDAGHAGWVAEVDELPGCLAQGSTPEEAVARIREAMKAWFTVALEEGMPIPEPRNGEEALSGRVLVRMARGLHAALAREARMQGVSTNQFAVSLLAGGIGWRKPRVTSPLPVPDYRPEISARQEAPDGGDASDGLAGSWDVNHRGALQDLIAVRFPDAALRSYVVRMAEGSNADVAYLDRPEAW